MVKVESVVHCMHSPPSVHILLSGEIVISHKLLIRALLNLQLAYLL